MMIDIKTEIGGIGFDNPIWIGSATPTWDGRSANLSFESGASAVVPKTFCSEAEWRKHPRTGRMFLKKIGKTNIGMLNIESFSTIDIDYWIKNELVKIDKRNGKFVASVLAMPDKKDTAKMINKIARTGLVDMIELNGSCPMHTTFSDSNMSEMIFEEVKNAKNSTDIPIIVKLSPNVTSLVEPSKAAKQAGASGVVISNSLKSFGGVNIDTGKPRIRTFSGYSGAAIKPIVQMHVVEVAKNVDIPICAVGGISDYKDVIEYIMIGASAVQIVSSVMWNGYGIIEKIIKDIKSFMKLKGYEKINDFKGIALKEFTSMDELVREKPKFACVDQSKCIRCYKCEKVCFYNAIHKVDNKITINSNCDGCNMCVQMCPVNAIELKY